MAHNLNPYAKAGYREPPFNDTNASQELRSRTITQTVNDLLTRSGRHTRMKKDFLTIRDMNRDGTDMGGVVVGPEWSYDRLLMYRKDFGGVLAAKSAWPILVYGVPSLAVRFTHQMQTAQRVAEFLEQDRRIASVSYPGLDSFKQRVLAHTQMHDYEGNFAPGVLMYFIPKGSTAAERHRRAERLVDHIAEHAYTMTLAVSLGNIRTLIEHPSSMTHAAIPPDEQVKRGMEPGGIRLSVGLEKPEDIIYDLQTSLDAMSAEPIRKSRLHQMPHLN